MARHRVNDDRDAATENDPVDLVRRYWLPVVLIVVGVLFVVQNTARTQFNFLWFEFDWPLWIMLVVFAAIGAVIAWAVGLRRRARKAGL
jgi:uncharacterized integral membrane protein